MKTLKITTLALLVLLTFDTAMAQMVRNRAIHFSRRRVHPHHHVKK